MEASLLRAPSGDIIFLESTADFVDLLIRLLHEPIGSVLRWVKPDIALSQMQDSVLKLRDHVFVQKSDFMADVAKGNLFDGINFKTVFIALPTDYDVYYKKTGNHGPGSGHTPGQSGYAMPGFGGKCGSCNSVLSTSPNGTNLRMCPQGHHNNNILTPAFLTALNYNYCPYANCNGSQNNGQQCQSCTKIVKCCTTCLKCDECFFRDHGLHTTTPICMFSLNVLSRHF